MPLAKVNKEIKDVEKEKDDVLQKAFPLGSNSNGRFELIDRVALRN